MVLNQRILKNNYLCFIFIKPLKIGNYEILFNEYTDYILKTTKAYFLTLS